MAFKACILSLHTQEHSNIARWVKIWYGLKPFEIYTCLYLCKEKSRQAEEESFTTFLGT